MLTRSSLRSLGFTLASALVCTLLPAQAFAAGYLSAEPMTGKKISIDGLLREWPKGFDKLMKKGQLSGSTAIIGYDDTHLYLAADILDSKIVRTKQGSQSEDHLSLEIYFPSETGAGRTHRVDVYPGIAGKLGALVKVDGKEIANAQAIEAPSDKGFTLESKIPWSSIPSASHIRVGMRGKLTYYDASAPGRIQSTVTAGSGSGKNMTPLTTEPETGLAQALLEPKELGFLPDREVYGDLTGKGGPEKVALYGHFLSITGPGYMGGKQFYFNELDVASASQITRLSLLDFNGDGKKEIIIQKRLGAKEEYREIIQVLQVGKDGAPVSVFMHEVAIVNGRGLIQNDVKIKGSGSSARIVVSQGKANGFEPGSFQEPTFGEGVPSALLPWESVKSREYGWKGQGLAATNETNWTPKVEGSSARSTSSSTAVAQAVAPPAPRAPTSEERLDRVYGLYKQERGVKRGGKASFDFVTDVVEDEQMERVVVHDRDLVVFGKGFKKGLSYTYLTIGVSEAKDVLSVTTRDLLGDGKAEIIVHGVLNAQASESLGGEIVSRQGLFVYKVVGEKLVRIFAAETGRSLKGKRVLSSVAFLPRNGGYDIELRPLRALGWTQKDYPFPEDRTPAGGLEPLLLPWGSVGPRRYSYSGSSYQQK